MSDIAGSFAPESSRASSSTAVPTSAIAKDGRQKINLEEDMVIPYVGHKELGLSEPLCGCKSALFITLISSVL